MTGLLNLGCGPDWRAAPEGWAHADVVDHGQQYVVDLAAEPATYPWPLGSLQCQVMHHVLHMLAPDDARHVLHRLLLSAEPGGLLRIGERNLWAGLQAHNQGGQWLHDVVSDDVEPTIDGKLLRWLTWHGTVRSLWSPESLIDALLRVGWRSAYVASHGQSRHPQGWLLDGRPWETFYVEAIA